MIEALSGSERRRRRLLRKNCYCSANYGPRMTVSHIARLHGLNANQVFTWRRQYQNGSLTAVSAAEEMVPALALTAAKAD